MNDDIRPMDDRCSCVNRMRWVLLLLGGGLLTWSAFTTAPSSDEFAHLLSGVAMVRTGDPGYYRVNPPLHKLLSGLVVDAVYRPPLPNLYPASMMASGSRGEFDLAAPAAWSPRCCG